MPDANGDVPPTPPAPAVEPGDAATAPAPPRKQQTLPYEAFPRAGGAVIDVKPGAVSVRIAYHHDRPWGVIVGFGVMALFLAAYVVYSGTRRGPAAVSPNAVVGSVLFALLALAASVRGRTPPLHLIAGDRGLRLRGGVMAEMLEWRRDEVLAVNAEDLERPDTRAKRIAVVIEFTGDEYAVFPVATREEQAAIVEALRGALKLAPLPPPPQRVLPVDP